MGVNLDDILGNKQQDVLVDKSKRTLNFLMIGVLITVIIIAVIATKMYLDGEKDKSMARAKSIARDASFISKEVSRIYDEYKQTGNGKLLVGRNQEIESEDKIRRLKCGGSDLEFRYGYYYLTDQEVRSIISGTPLEVGGAYIVKYSTGEVISMESVKWNGKNYYEVEDLQAIARGETPPCDYTITINSPQDMENFAKHPNLIYRLNHDIDMSAFNGGNGWTPIPTFTGRFDGRGYKIRNMKINNSSQAKAGLFGTIEADAFLKNLVLENIDVSGGDYVGAIAGSCSGTITNCTVTGNVRSTGRYCGGLFGSFEGHASQLKSSVSVNGDQYVGGFAGQVTGGEIIQCSVKGNEVSIIGNNDCVGGLVGLVQSNRDLQVSESCADAKIYGTEKVGGLVGWINAANSLYNLDINNCYAQGNIERCEEAAGGFVGALSSSGRANINISYNYTICKTPKQCVDVGGFVGNIAQSSAPSVRYCYWERQSLTEQNLSENGVGSSSDNTVKFDPLTPSAIKLQTSFSGWDSVIKNWRFSNNTAPTLSWE